MLFSFILLKGKNKREKVCGLTIKNSNQHADSTLQLWTSNPQAANVVIKGGTPLLENLKYANGVYVTPKYVPYYDFFFSAVVDLNSLTNASGWDYLGIIEDSQLNFCWQSSVNTAKVRAVSLWGVWGKRWCGRITKAHRRCTMIDVWKFTAIERQLSRSSKTESNLH